MLRFGWFCSFVVRLVAWLVGCLLACFVDWLVGCLVGWLVGWLVLGWAGFVGRSLVGLSVGWLVGWWFALLVGIGRSRKQQQFSHFLQYRLLFQGNLKVLNNKQPKKHSRQQTLDNKQSSKKSHTNNKQPSSDSEQQLGPSSKPHQTKCGRKTTYKNRQQPNTNKQRQTSGQRSLTPITNNSNQKQQ